MLEHNTIYDNNIELDKDDYRFIYQKELTERLDNIKCPFDQNIINEIVLWKVNRFVKIDEDTLKLLNDIDSNATVIDEEKTRLILKKLINKRGIQLPMASTILRFRNKNIYQIIDQRVYRVIYKNKKLKLKSYFNEKNLSEQIDVYLQYLKDLKVACEYLDIPFNDSDRILYMADKRINKNIPLDNY